MDHNPADAEARIFFAGAGYPSGILGGAVDHMSSTSSCVMAYTSFTRSERRRSLHLAVTILGAFLDDPYLVWTEVEKFVDALV